jgi:hypothetical protein
MATQPTESLASALMATTPATATLSSGVLFNDTSGAPLHAHGLGIHPGADPLRAGAASRLAACRRSCVLFPSTSALHF